jgi:SAM-dependent methyltransferase
LPAEVQDWYSRAARHFEQTYLGSTEPWCQSGHFGSLESWERLRRPIAACVDRPGRFLDIGCANGYLLECLLSWTRERGIAVEAWGLDLSSRLVALARERLPGHEVRLDSGNSLEWAPPVRFDYVRTGLHYAPPGYESRHLRRLQSRFLAPGGRLLVVEYRGQEHQAGPLRVDQRLRDLGFPVEAVRVATGDDGLEGARVAVVPAAPA